MPPSPPGNPDAPRSRRRAEALSDRYRETEAIRIAKDVLSEAPDTAPKWAAITRVHLAVDEPGGCGLAAGKKAFRLDSEDAWIARLLAAREGAVGKLKSARKWGLRQLELNPDDIQAPLGVNEVELLLSKHRRSMRNTTLKSSPTWSAKLAKLEDSDGSKRSRQAE